MEYALFIGCNIPARVPQYETASRLVLEKLGVTLVDVPEYNCCGYPMRNTDRDSFLLSAAKNLALSEQKDTDTLVLCKCCFGAFKHAEHMLLNDEALLAKVNENLAPLGLKYEGKTKITHLFTLLYELVGENNVKNSMEKAFADLKVATHNGCHALRPSKITQFDNALEPVIFDSLVAWTGAKNVDWKNRLECCGAPLMGSSDPVSLKLLKNKLDGAKEGGAQFLISGCPWCQIQFDTVQSRVFGQNGDGPGLPVILYPQLLGLAMGLEPQALGLDAHEIDAASITDYLK